MKTTVTYAPEEITKLVEADLNKRGFNIVSKAKMLVTTKTEGDQRVSWQVAEFNGVEVDVSPKNP